MKRLMYAFKQAFRMLIKPSEPGSTNNYMTLADYERPSVPAARTRVCDLAIHAIMGEAIAGAVTDLLKEVSSDEICTAFPQLKEILEDMTVLQMLHVDKSLVEYPYVSGWHDKFYGIGPITKEQVENYILESHPATVEAVLIRARIKMAHHESADGVSYLNHDKLIDAGLECLVATENKRSVMQINCIHSGTGTYKHYYLNILPHNDELP